jgi:tRNA 2-thiouridine synthesizing protein A
VKRLEVDCRRMLCPMPVIKVQAQVANLAPGDELAAICSDPGALNDIPSWSRINGHEVLETRSAGHEYIVVIRVGEAAS